jgi:hypothetical protein
LNAHRFAVYPVAVEPMRKAYVFSDRMLGLSHEETLRIKADWERAIDEATLAKLRFRAGDHRPYRVASKRWSPSIA